MNKSFNQLINSSVFHTAIFRTSIVVWLILSTISTYRVSVSLSRTQADIAQRLGHRYSSEDATKDNKKRDDRFTDLERRVGILEAQWKTKGRQ